MGAAGEEEQTQERIGSEEKILVSVRLRPLNEKEIARNEVSDWECIDDNTIIYRNNLSISERSMYPTAYTFDRVFSCKCSTRQVYEEGAKKVALSVVRGINSSVFAYGQTSSGKTYTMSGITEYTVADIYDYMEKHKEREFVLKFSAMEIYNESVRDLLSADSSPLRLLDDPERGTVVERLTEETLRDWNHFKELLSVCEAQRQIGETALNETSSRSHQILRLTIDSLAREFLGCDKSSTLSATVNFVDLAGSERASQSLSAGTRLKEGCHINRSLLTLGTVIRKLSKGRNGHVPYRDSKLTRILQSSLGGNARTAVICTMSPARVHVEQSRNTLLFASCAKEVTTNAQVNLVMSDKALVKHLQRELTRLESELRDSGSNTVKSDLATRVREKDHEIENLKKEITELTLQRDLARSQLEDLLHVVEDDRPPKVELGYNYPQLRVRSSMDFEEPTSGMTAVEGSHGMDIGVGSFDAAQYSDGHSSSTCNDQEEYSVQLPDSEEIFPCSISSPRLSISSVESNMQQEGTKKHIHLNQVKVGREVHPDELEESIPYGVVASNMSGLNSYAESPEEKSGILLGAFEDEDIRNQGLKSPQWMEDEEPNSNHHPFVTTSSRKSSPSLLEKENSTSGDTKLTRDRSSSASFRANFPSPQYEKIEKNKSTPLSDIESDIAGRPEGLEGKATVLKFDVDFSHENLSRNNSQTSTGIATGKDLNVKDAGDHELEINHVSLSINDSQIPIRPASVKGLDVQIAGANLRDVQDAGCSEVDVQDVGGNDELHVQDGGNDELDVRDVRNSCRDKDFTLRTFASDGERMADFQQEKLHKDQMAPLNELKSTSGGKSVRDIGLDPIQDLQESPRNWPVEFKRLQREIIELWHACSIPLVHRSNFFLLFKGDPADSIYMEVELRRLSFIKEKSYRGNQISGENSSAKALRKERQMLSRRMNRLSHKDRQNLYRKWGIGLNTKNRRLQLAHHLWSDIRDMEHIAASAALVARLVGSVDQDNALKEMFGFSFAPQPRGNKNFYHSIKRSMKPLLSS